MSNVGNLPTDGSTITVTDPLPDAFTSFANAGGDGWACSIPARTLVCTRSGALADGDSFPPIFIDVTLADPAPASIINTVSVAGGGDVNPDNNTATDVGGTAQAADLRITKIAAPSTVFSGADGPVHAHGLQRRTVDRAGRDRQRSAAARTTATPPRRPSVGSCTAAVQCSLGDLARGESATITIDATHRGQRHDPDQHGHGRARPRPIRRPATTPRPRPSSSPRRPTCD